MEMYCGWNEGRGSDALHYHYTVTAWLEQGIGAYWGTHTHTQWNTARGGNECVTVQACNLYSNGRT